MATQGNLNLKGVLLLVLFNGQFTGICLRVVNTADLLKGTAPSSTAIAVKIGEHRTIKTGLALCQMLRGLILNELCHDENKIMFLRELRNWDFSSSLFYFCCRCKNRINNWEAHIGVHSAVPCSKATNRFWGAFLAVALSAVRLLILLLCFLWHLSSFLWLDFKLYRTYTENKLP